MPTAGDSSSILSAVLFVFLTGAFFVPNIFSYLPEEGLGQRMVAQSGIQPDFLMQIEPNQFLIRNGTRNPDIGVAFTSLNGFSGNITLNAMVSPVGHSAPTILLTTSVVTMNVTPPWSQQWDPMTVSTTGTTALGLYNVTVIAHGASISHSATAAVGVTSAYVPPNSAELVYKAHFGAVAHVGGSTNLESTFENLGYVNIGITNLTVNSTFGIFHIDQGCRVIYMTTCSQYSPLSPYVSLSPFREEMTEFPIQIPTDTMAGNYTIIVTVNWVLDLGSINVQSAPDLVAHGFLMVYSSPPNPLIPSPPQTPSGLSTPSDFGLRTILFPLLATGAAITIILVGLNRVAVREKRNRPNAERFRIASSSCARCGMQTSFGAQFCPRCGQQIL